MPELRLFHLRLTACALLALLGGAARATADQPAACLAIAARVDAIPGAGPAFLSSYDAAPGVPDEPALNGAAFAYDNALAVIALTACGRPAQADRIGRALLAASAADRSGQAGRIRNAYRAGPVAEYPPPPMGWWDARAGRWLEDPYQIGSASGNLAWTGLALMTLHQTRGDAVYRDGAARVAHWVSRFRDDRGPGGFSGGVQGFDDAPLGWKSTEHNADLAALFSWLARTGGGDWDEPARAARGFVAAMWRPAEGRFLIGTAPDGVTPAPHPSGLDAQLWPPLLADADPAWGRAFGHALSAHGAEGGLDFNDDRDGLWTEGTAQGALTALRLGRRDDAARLLARATAMTAPGGYLWATRAPSISTGLAIGPDSTRDDFRYYRRPHLAATAWAVLAATAWNPLTGRRLNGDAPSAP